MPNAANSWQKKDFSNEKGVLKAQGQAAGNWSTRKTDVYESDAKALAGKEQREMEKLFGKSKVSGGSTSRPVSSGKKWQPKSGGGQLPSMFTNQGAGGTLMTGGNSAVNKKSGKGTVGGPTFGADAAGGKKWGTGSSVSKWSQGSSATMEKTGTVKSGPTVGADVGGKKYGTGSSVSKWNMGSSATMGKSDTVKSGPTFGHDAGNGKFTR